MFKSSANRNSKHSMRESKQKGEVLINNIDEDMPTPFLK